MALIKAYLEVWKCVSYTQSNGLMSSMWHSLPQICFNVTIQTILIVEGECLGYRFTLSICFDDTPGSDTLQSDTLKSDTLTSDMLRNDMLRSESCEALSSLVAANRIGLMAST